jgi:hypothetical protein
VGGWGRSGGWYDLVLGKPGVTEREGMTRGYSGLLELEEITSYKIDYSAVVEAA